MYSMSYVGICTFIYSVYRYTVDENIIATIKMRNNFCYPLEMVIFPILLSQFSIAPHLVIALPTLR